MSKVSKQNDFTSGLEASNKSYGEYQELTEVAVRMMKLSDKDLELLLEMTEGEIRHRNLKTWAKSLFPKKSLSPEREA